MMMISESIIVYENHAKDYVSADYALDKCYNLLKLAFSRRFQQIIEELSILADKISIHLPAHV